VEAPVVAILGPRKPLELVAHSVACKTTQIHGDHLVHGLRRAVGLWVEHRREIELDSGQGEQLVPELARENGARSFTMELGTPCNRTIPSKNACATDVVV
jgi:hypothetical protein